jgi:hypothetical protein
LSPITVQSQDLEERWMEQYSLISLFLPMCRKHSSPVLYFKSWHFIPTVA